MAIVWDASGSRRYETGVKNAVLYTLDSSGVYTNGVAWNGITSVTETPSGADASKFYADDMKYIELRAAEDFGATVEAYTYPDEWMLCDGSAELVPGVMLGQQTRNTFGLCYRTVIGNDQSGESYGYKLHLIYNATASPSERAYSTINDSPEAIQFSWEITTTPINVTGYKATAIVIIDSTKVNATKLKNLEDILYGVGSGNTTPRMPLPDEIATILAATQSGT